MREEVERILTAGEDGVWILCPVCYRFIPVEEWYEDSEEVITYQVIASIGKGCVLFETGKEMHSEPVDFSLFHYGCECDGTIKGICASDFCNYCIAIVVLPDGNHLLHIGEKAEILYGKELFDEVRSVFREIGLLVDLQAAL